MKTHHRIAKATAASLQQLRDQTDLGCEKQHALAGGQGFLAAAQVHLGFAGAGDTPEQPGLLISTGLDGLQHTLLFSTEWWWLLSRTDGFSRALFVFQMPSLCLEQLALLQGLHDGTA